MFIESIKREFSNGVVYAMKTEDGYPIETTDTFLPYYTKFAINEHTNKLKSDDVGSRKERWMIGVSCMSSCPVHCRFCATGQLKRTRKLSAQEIVDQVKFILVKNHDLTPSDSKEFKINYTRCGEPFLNIEAVKEAIRSIDAMLPGVRVHHYISTIGLRGMDTSWIKDNITLQLSLHSTDEIRRNDLIPVSNLMSIEELGKVRTESELKTTINMTLVDTADFNIDVIKKNFDPDYFFIKISPINVNSVSEANHMGAGIIKAVNLI
jgi:23S rRNA (adenine2503-C2)-methyltransferase